MVAVVHALAVATLAALDGERDVQSSRWLLRGVLVRTERFAVLPPQQRSGRYEDVAATGPEGSLDAAITYAVGRGAIAIVVSDELLDHHRRARRQRGDETLLDAAGSGPRAFEDETGREAMPLRADQCHAAESARLGCFGSGTAPQDVGSAKRAGRALPRAIIA